MLNQTWTKASVLGISGYNFAQLKYISCQLLTNHFHGNNCQKENVQIFLSKNPAFLETAVEEHWRLCGGHEEVTNS